MYQIRLFDKHGRVIASNVLDSLALALKVGNHQVNQGNADTYQVTKV
jgi:hypothetical protein